MHLQSSNTAWYMVEYDLSGMTHLTYSSVSLLFHMTPPSLTTQSMLASMMMSLDKRRLVIPDKIIFNFLKRVAHSDLC